MESFLQLHTRAHAHAHEPFIPSDKVAIIVEPRANHPYLEYVVRNAMACLDATWAFQIWTHEKAAEDVQQRFSDMSLEGRLTVRKIPMNSMTTTLYNCMFMSAQFWESIGDMYEHILIFQTDCVFFQKWQNEWFAYDYLGANYYNSLDTSPKIGGIQGGLSYRKKSVMIDCIRRVSVADANQYRRSLGYLPIAYYKEDVFFTHACEMLGKCVPRPSDRPAFSIEAEFYETPFGHHGWNKNYFNADQIALLLGRSIFANTQIA